MAKIFTLYVLQDAEVVVACICTWVQVAPTPIPKSAHTLPILTAMAVNNKNSFCFITNKDLGLKIFCFVYLLYMVRAMILPDVY